MRIAQIMAGAPQGGAELFFERLCAALAASGDTVLPLIRKDPGRRQRLEAAGLAPQTMRFGGSWDVLTRWQLRRTLQRFQPRVAVAWMGRAARHTPPGPWILAGRLGGYYTLSQFRHCDHLIANTPALRDWIVAQGEFPPARVHVLPNFVPDMEAAAQEQAVPSPGLPAPRSRDPLPGVPEGAPLVLALGRLHRSKGFDLLIAAISRLPGVHLAIAGDGPEADALRRLAHHAGAASRVHFLGWRRDTAALLARATLLACPSRQEVLGNVVLEAFSARRPVVASMADGPRQLIESGRTGILVAQESAIALAAGIDGLLADPIRAAAMAAAGRARYEAEFAEAPVMEAWAAWLAGVEKTK